MLVISSLDYKTLVTDRVTHIYLHSLKMNIKELNVRCFCQNNSVVVADFGLARLMLEEKNQDKLSSGQIPGVKKTDRRKRYTVVGNPYWMAPEMIHGEDTGVLINHLFVVLIIVDLKI